MNTQTVQSPSNLSTSTATTATNFTTTFDAVSHKFYKAYSLFTDAERAALVQFAAHIPFRCADIATATDYAQGIHTPLLLANRDLYAMLLVRSSRTAETLTDLDKQLGVYFLLSANAAEGETRYLSDEDVKAVIIFLLDSIKQPRNVLRPFEMIADARINRSSIQRFTLRFWLNHPDIMSYSTNFGNVLNKVLTHAWGKKNADILRSMMQKQELFDYEEKFLYEHLVKNLSLDTNAEEIFCALLIAMKPVKVS